MTTGNMTTENARVLIADDQPAILEALRFVLGETCFDLEMVTSTDAVRERVGTQKYDLLLMDLNYARDTTSGREGLELLSELHERDDALPIVVMTGWGNIETAVDAMRRGARSFVQKPWDNAALLDVVTREINAGRASRRAEVRSRSDRLEAIRIQRALLPSTPPSIAGCELAATWKPAAGLGGDCYDAIAFSPTQLGLSIADVVGKGLPAALLMANLQASVRALANGHAHAEGVATAVNRLLCGRIATGKFITFCYVAMDMETSQVVYTNAGHNPPVLVRATGAVERLATTGIVLGVVPDALYEQRTIELRRGDRLVLFTDGITEAENSEGEQFGEERLTSTIVTHRCESAQELIDAIVAAASGFTGGEFQDDATVMCAAIA
jgi:sigma-B regulation protein RsbU (phosphoserine phosphatase)